MKTKVEYLPDASIDADLDQELRTLLTTCFTKPQDVVFQERRYFREPYPHRWVVRKQTGTIIAHVGVHEKWVEADGKMCRVGGICEVCVHPDFRGRGFVKLMLTTVHNWLVRQRYDFAILFGDPAVYGSSGYVQVWNLFHETEGEDGKKQRKQVTAMVKQLSDQSWPATDVYLPGPAF